MTDEELLRSDFGAFYDRYVRALLAFFQRRVGDPEAAADLTAETFAAALVGRARFRGDAPVAWLFSIAHRKLADYHRRGYAETRMRARLGMERVEVTAEDAELVRRLGEEVATQLIADLPAEQREAIRAHVLDGRRYADIAREQRSSEVAVRQRVSRGLRILREKMR
jgi:RNA polymerase sigma-70 factor (ECF subfamily)